MSGETAENGEVSKESPAIWRVAALPLQTGLYKELSVVLNE
jgi:hypothetical protein